jgi:hypothetical protein
MERSHFAVVKEAFAADLDSSLQALGLVKVNGGNPQWQHINCPCCTDTDGSCSISKATGFINCKQCSRKLDLFEWWKEKHSLEDDWAASKQVGDLLGIPYQKAKKKRGREAARMTVERLDRAIANLCEDPDAEWARKHFADRGLWRPQILARFGIGFLDGSIVFAQFNPDGSLRERYRIYAPLAKVKWRWSKNGRGGPIGFWPAVPEIPKGAEILLCEGEMDCLAAWIMLELNRRETPIVPFTWTGGAGSPLASSLMPDAWRGRTVYVCYDNDTFQGPDFDSARAPTPRKLREMGRRRQSLVNGVCEKLAANKCKVKLLHVALDPVDNFGADLRDWATKKKGFDELPVCDLADLVEHREDPINVSHRQVFENAGEYVSFQGAVATIEKPALTVPISSKIVCPAGTKTCCKDCPVLRLFPDGDVDWSQHRDKLLNGLMSKDPEAYWIRRLVCKPAACNECAIVHDETVVGSFWQATASDDDDDGNNMLNIVSTESPSLSGEVGITGYAHYGTNSVGVLATKLVQLDKPDVRLEDFHVDLMGMTPWNSNDQAEIDRYIDSVVLDYSQNITQIYGRPEFHIGTMLVAHSALWYDLDGHRYRAWLDACFFGETRQGKSETVKRLFEYWRLGTSFTCMENYSRAGLTVGGADNGSKMKPGLFPKNNRKMLFLDEFHHMTNGPADKNVMVHLQSARDEGRVSALKVYGDVKLPAAVRLITAGNWANRSRRTFQYFCQHLLSFYGVPESLSRMDFAWCVHSPAKMTKQDVDHQWTPELARALILRGWAMEPHQIHLGPEAVQLAKQVASEWDSIYAAEDLPLHTGIEKHHSIIRIAIAAANMCYSHPEGKERECMVRLVHVQWAIAWIIRCWQNLKYDEYSQRVIQARTVKQPFHVEAAFTIYLDLDDPDQAIVMLSRLCETNSLRSLQSLVTGCGQIEEFKQFARWHAHLQRSSALQESTGYRNELCYGPTEGALNILHGLIDLARNNPEAYVARFRELENWNNAPESRGSLPGITHDPVNLQPLDVYGETYDDDCPF